MVMRPLRLSMSTKSRKVLDGNFAQYVPPDLAEAVDNLALLNTLASTMPQIINRLEKFVRNWRPGGK